MNEKGNEYKKSGNEHILFLENRGKRTHFFLVQSHVGLMPNTQAHIVYMELLVQSNNMLNT